MWWARDIKSKIVTRMTDTTYGINALITTINTERSETTETAYQINAEQDEGQYPLVFIDLGDSVVSEAIGTEYQTMIETFNLEITIFLMGSNITKLKNDTENYIEAVCRCLEGYNEQSGENSYICEINAIQRMDIDTIDDRTLRTAAINMLVYRNQL
jgi:hypothetical protein